MPFYLALKAEAFNHTSEALEAVNQAEAVEQRSSAFNAGVALERQRVVFALNLRKAIARHLQNRSEGSGDESAVALLKLEKKEITVEPAPSPRESRALTEGEQAFAAALCAKINRTLRPEARRR